MARVIAVYDACDLYSAPLRDFLVELAMTGLFDARWTDAIHDEWTRNVAADRPDLDPARLQRTRELMDIAVPGCLVTGYEALIPDLELPDADDRHVLAAAIRAGAGVIVTLNLRDFPPDPLAAHGVAARHPDDFVSGFLERRPARVLRAARTLRARLRNPPVSPEDFLAGLERQSLARTAARLRESAADL